MIAALARAARVFDNAHWLTLAEAAFTCVATKLATADDRLLHSFRDGRAKAPATASDYANMIWAALRLFRRRNRKAILRRPGAGRTCSTSIIGMADGGGYFTAADDTTDVVVRLKSASDDASPSANAIHLSNLIALAAITGESRNTTSGRWNSQMSSAGTVARSPTAHCGLMAAELDLGRIVQVAVIGADAEQLKTVLESLSLPGAITFVSDDGLFRPGLAARRQVCPRREINRLCVRRSRLRRPHHGGVRTTERSSDRAQLNY